jgi:hypothetical protein
VPAPLAVPSPGSLTTRQRFTEHSQNPACAACHQLFDPIGFVLENYDGYGRWRTEDNGQPIDAHGVLQGTSFDGPAGLAYYMSAPERTPHCLVLQWFRYALGRSELDVDDCTLGVLQDAFDQRGQRLQDLILAIVTNDAFLTRRTLPAGP